MRAHGRNGFLSGAAWAARTLQRLRFDPNEVERFQRARLEEIAHAGSLSGRLRDECLNVSGWRDLDEECRFLKQWREDNNEARSPSSLLGRAPATYVAWVLKMDRSRQLADLFASGLAPSGGATKRLVK